jgi:hypothetical protein
MLVLYGDSMLSGFPTMREIPSHMILPGTVITDEPLVSIPQSMRELGVEVQCCAEPAHTSVETQKWFDQVPQWWGEPTIFWFGRCEKPISHAPVLTALRHMTERVTGQWWVCAIPMSIRDTAKGTDGLVRDANSAIRDFAEDRFLDPIDATGGNPLPAAKRIDVLHPNSDTNLAIASWLLKNTIWKQARSPLDSSACGILWFTSRRASAASRRSGPFRALPSRAR